MVGLEARTKIWLDGKIVPWDDAKVHVLTHALHYGYAVFEGIRCHRTDRGPAVFRLPEHMARLLQSAKIYGMQVPYSQNDLCAATVQLLRADGVEEAYIRPLIFSGYGQMGLDPRKVPIQVAIAMWTWGAYLGEANRDSGVRAVVSSWVRNDARSLPPQAKCAANYANSILAKMEANAGGYDEAILLNSAGVVAEGPGENIFRVKNGVLGTPPASAGILRGITRDTILQFAREEGVVFHRGEFTREELYTADELFFTGTAAGVTPIREVDGRPIGDGKYPLTHRFQTRYEEAIRGRSQAHAYWLTYVRNAGA